MSKSLTQSPLAPFALIDRERIWLYHILSSAVEIKSDHTGAKKADTKKNFNHKMLQSIDDQLFVEMVMDSLCDFFLTTTRRSEIPTDRLVGVLSLWQNQARDGFYLDEILKPWIPEREFRCFEGRHARHELPKALSCAAALAFETALTPPAKIKSFKSVLKSVSLKSSYGLPLALGMATLLYFGYHIFGAYP